MAQAFHDSDAYRPLKALRVEATDSCGVLFDGFDQPPAG